MSHDIRTPLNAIVGMTELALIDRDNPAQIMESLLTIQEASNHLISLINSILEMSRIESGKMVTADEKFRQSDILEKLAQLAAPVLKSKNQKLSIITDIEHDKCTGDALRLSRVLENLVSNAMKFTPPGGIISVSCQELPRQQGDEMASFRYTVTDTGVGMTSGQLECIFEPFYRVGTSTTTGVEGSGLGLAIVKSTLELMGGIVEVRSTPGKGSSFTVEVPFRICGAQQRDSGESSHAALPEKADFTGINVLLVEDHPINAIVVSRMLEKAGVAVTLASNGLEGFERFKVSGSGEFDAVLMDIQMPVMNGYESASAIRECDHPRARTVPIIAMTANAFTEDVKKAIASGMNDHVAKPVKISRLYEVLGNLSKYEPR